MPTPFWIGPSDWRDDAHPILDHPYLFTKTLSLLAAPSSALVKIAAWWKYALEANGVSVAWGPARSYPHRMFYDEVDLAPHLLAGENRISVTVLPGTGSTAYWPVARLALFIDGEVVCGGARVPLVTDGSWQAGPDLRLRLDGLVSIPTDHRENWLCFPLPAQFEGRPPFVFGPAGAPPFFDLVPRPVPPPTRTPARPPLVWRGHHPAANHPDAPLRLKHTRLIGEPVAPAEPPPRVRLEPGEVVTFDFGRTRLVHPSLDVIAADPGAVLRLYYDIRLDARPSCADGFGHPIEQAADRVPLLGAGRWQTLAPRGFRYLTLLAQGAASTVALACATVDYPYGAARACPVADPFLGRVWHTSAETLRSATNDVIVDTCSRENVLWTFDACAAAKAAFHTFGEATMWRRCLSLIAEGVDDRGIPHGVVPHGPTSAVLVDQSLYFVVSCADYLALTGDASLAAEVAPALARFLSLCERHLTPEDVFVPPAWSWHWVDWAPIPKRAYSMPVNALLLWAADAAARVAARAGTASAGLAVVAQRVAARVRPALARFWDAGQECFANTLAPAVDVGPESAIDPIPTPPIPYGVHANALAIHVGVGTPDQRRAAAAFVARCLDAPLGPINTFGPGWTDLILTPLLGAGHADAALRFVRRAYGAWLDAGEPTWHERFDPAEGGNTAHAWGASVNSFIAALASPS